MRSLALILCLTWTVAVAADPTPIALAPGRPHEEKLELAGETARAFAIAVPDGAFALHVRLTDTPLDLEITAKRDGADDEWTGADNALSISRADDTPLATGRYVVTVDYVGGAPYYRGRRLSLAPYTILATLVVPKVDGELRPGTWTEGRIVATEGRMRTYAVEVPADARALRLDLDATVADLDLYVRQGEVMVTTDDADHAASTTASRDWLVIDKASDPPLAPGRWCVMVYEPTGEETATYALHVTFDRSPPPALCAIPAIPVGATPLERAIGATVEVSTGIQGGSGTIVSPDGLVLTNHHVVQAVIAMLAREGRAFASRDVVQSLRPADPEALDELVLGATLDPRRPAVELFRGQLLAYDEEGDLALVRITTGFYGQPLPAGYVFPWVPLGDPGALRHGDELRFLGFPTIASLRTRPTATLTRGIVSGFEASHDGRQRIRSDGLISGGNSGGAALDARGALVGVPSMTMSDGSGNAFGYTYSIADLPRPWRALIDTATSRAGTGK